MTDKSDTQTSDPGKPRKRGFRRYVAMAVLALASAFAGAFATKAVSHSSHWGSHFGHYRGFKHTRGPMWFMRGPIDPEWAAKRAEHRAKHFAIEVDATPEQTKKLVDISTSLTADILPLRKKIRDARKDAVALLTADNIDRAAIEQLRAQQLAEFDAATKRVTLALADAAEVLTAEQRQKVNEWVEKRRKHRGWWWRRHRDEDRSEE